MWDFQCPEFTLRLFHSSPETSLQDRGSMDVNSWRPRKGDSLFLLNDRVCSLRNGWRALPLGSAVLCFFFFFFFLSSSSKSMSAWQTEETSVWLSRPRQSDCKEGTTSHAPPQTLNKPMPASTLCANLRETCPAPPFPGRLCCDKNQTSRSQSSSQGFILPWSWPHLVWERKAICGSPG